MISDKKTSPIHPYMEYLRIFVAHISKLASIRKEKSFENLKFQTQTQQVTEKIKDRRSELKVKMSKTIKYNLKDAATMLV